jgi:hypothetical protein
MIQWRALVKTVMKLRIQLWTNANFSGRSYPLRNWIWRGIREKLHGENVSVKTIRSAERLQCYIIQREHYFEEKKGRTSETARRVNPGVALGHTINKDNCTGYTLRRRKDTRKDKVTGRRRRRRKQILNYFKAQTG